MGYSEQRTKPFGKRIGNRDRKSEPGPKRDQFSSRFERGATQRSHLLGQILKLEDKLTGFAFRHTKPRT